MKKDKYVGICKVGEKGQIVIPKEARRICPNNRKIISKRTRNRRL